MANHKNQKFIVIRDNIFVFLLIIFFGFLFFYRLGWNSLVSWDEAWYGVIARNIVESGNFIHMVWKEKPYYDHPPLGFWLMAICYKLFGINEFSTRLPSALLGLLSILIIYKVGLELFKNRRIGFVSALILGTSVWYLIRVRSGNLDSIFVFFYILTIYLSLKSAHNFRWFPMAMISWGCLILSKTLIGFSAGILILFLNLKQFFNLKKNWWLIILGLILLVIIVYPWYYIHLKTYPLFFQDHFINIGTRNKTFSSYFKIDPQLPLFYLHMGVRKWYYLWLASLVFIILTFKFLKKSFFFLLLWNFIILYPFLTTNQTQIWHLIPVYLPFSLITASGVYFAGMMIVSFMKKFIKIRKWLVEAVYLLFFLILTMVQFKNFYREVYPTSKYIPDDVDIAKKAAKYNQKIYLDDDFTPLAIFYSGKNITPLIDLPDEKRTLVKFFKSDEKNFIIITRNWAVNNLLAENIPYRLLEKNNSFSILTRP